MRSNPAEEKPKPNDKRAHSKTRLQFPGLSFRSGDLSSSSCPAIEYEQVDYPGSAVTTQQTHKKIMKLKTYLNACIVIITASVTPMLACDGPKLNPGYTFGSCACAGTGSSTTCGGPVVTINSWYSCGGDGNETCSTAPAEVGTSAPCVRTFQTVAYNIAYLLWLTCVPSAENGWTCPPRPDGCAYTTCTVSTSTTPIIDNEVYAGSDGECHLAKIRVVPLRERIASLLSNYPQT